MLKEDKEIEQGVFGCAAIVLFSILALVVSIAVGVFFGAGFGLLAFALFIVFAIAFTLKAFVKAGK